MTRMSTRNRMLQVAGGVAGLALAFGLAGCRVQVDKSANGEDKNVQVDTPFGGVHVNTDQTTAADIGLPVYPGAENVKDDKNGKAADVHLGFGEWELRVRVVNFSTPDSEDKVAAFYKKELGRYGNVISCRDNAAIGTPTVTRQGLSCSDANVHGSVKIDDSDYGSSKSSLQLKAGSKRHQHIVGFEDPKDGKTRFGLVALDLPSGVDTGDKSD